MDLLQSILIATALLLIVGVGIITLVLVYQKRQLQNLRERDQLKVSFEKEILESKLEIQEQTFKNISQEIHDNIGQLLSLAKLTINTMDGNNKDDLDTKISSTNEILGKAIRDLRDLSKSMHADNITELGLIRAIEGEFEMIKRAGYHTSLAENGDPFRLSNHHELIIFRIFQEVLNNIIKHAKASQIDVIVGYVDGIFSLQIQDNGCGFLYDKTKNNGMGLRNIQNRTRIIGAYFSLKSAPGSGTTATITLPPEPVLQELS